MIVKGILSTFAGLASPLKGLFGAAARRSGPPLITKGVVATQAVLSLGFFAFSRDPLSERLTNLAWDVGLAFGTLGMGSGWKQAFWSMAGFMIPHMADVTKGIVSGYRGALESRTSAYVPFSHSSAPMDQAFLTMQYAKTRVSGAYSNIGSEAAFMASRYMAR